MTKETEKLEEIVDSQSIKSGNIQELSSDAIATEIFAETNDNVHGDVGLDLYLQYEGTEFTVEEEKKTLRKIDLNLMPFLIISYFLQFLDKSALSQSSVFGLKTDLGLVGQQYSWCGSIFYFSYMLGQPLATYMCQRFSISKYVGSCLIMWSIILICTVGTKNFAGLATIRFLLGLFESCVSPSWVLLTGSFYLKDEQPIRVSFWYLGNALGVFLGGFIAYGLGHISSGSIPSWKWFYVVYGVLTFFWGIFLLFRLPDSIVNCRFLTEKEKYIAIERIKRNRTGIKNEEFKWSQVKEALTDFQIWWLALIEFVGCLPASGVSVFGTLIIQSFGFSGVNSVLLQSVSGVVQGLTLLLGGLIIAKVKNSANFMQAIVMIPCLIGTCIVKYLPNHPNSKRAGRLVGFWIQYSNTVADVSIFTLMTRNYSGYTKRTTANAMIFVAYCVGMIVGPQFFITAEAPGYATGFRMMIVTWIMLMFMPIILNVYYRRENNKREKLEEEARAQGKEIHIENEELLDLTDKQQIGFRYHT